MRPYNLPLGVAAAVNAVFYPMGAFTDGPAQNIGFEVGIEQEFGIQSSIGPNDSSLPNAKFGTTVHQFEGGARYRIPFGVDGHQVWFSLTGGEHAFVFTSDPNCANTTPNTCRGNLDIPDTIYRYIRPGVGARFELGPNFAVAAALGYRYIFNGGGPQFGVFFPHHTVYGVDADAYLGYRFIPNLEVRAGIDFRQYGYAMHSTAADAMAIQMGNTTLKVAGGAVDRYIAGMVGVAFMYGGTPRPEAASGDEEAEAPPPPKKKKKHHHEDEDQGGGGGEDTSSAGGGDADR